MKIFLLSLLICLLSAKDNPKFDLLFKKAPVHKLVKEPLWFPQVLDHYNYDSKTTQYWNQRYWVYSDYFNPKSGPVFLYICGEWVCQGIPETRTWLMVLAQRLNGLVLALQHRFYGDSLPFGKDSFSIQNMALLNSEQALRDLAYFIQSIKTAGKYGVANNPWISVGGSYPGALSAWFRYKYPHLVIGAIASSAVVEAIEDFTDFDQQIYLSSIRSSPQCAVALNTSSHIVESILNKGQRQAFEFKSQFEGGQKLTNKQFMFFWADAIVLTIQYGGRTQICNRLKGQSQEAQFKILVENAKAFQVYEYGSFYLRNETFAYQTQSMARPWYYQYCTQYAFFQTFSPKHPMRSFSLNLDFYSQFCADAFGVGTWPKVSRKNTEYGALKAESSKILFPNGIEDPWRWASLQSSDSSDLIARVIDCDNCAHCVDMYTPEPSDPDNLKKARNEQYLTLQEWIDDYWRQTEREIFESILKSEI